MVLKCEAVCSAGRLLWRSRCTPLHRYCCFVFQVVVLFVLGLLALPNELGQPECMPKGPSLLSLLSLALVLVSLKGTQELGRWALVSPLHLKSTSRCTGQSSHFMAWLQSHLELLLLVLQAVQSKTQAAVLKSVQLEAFLTALHLGQLIWNASGLKSLSSPFCPFMKI